MPRPDPLKACDERDNPARASFLGAYHARLGDSIDANPYTKPELRRAWECAFTEFYNFDERAA